ncbi:MAG: hypothetical protein JSS68_18880 [Actinobacteria bacterium]|nr:hypothetical protein [Actinomycetota bacterium]
MSGHRVRDRVVFAALLGVLLSALLLGATGSAFGYFTTTGSGTVATGVGSLTVPTISSAKAAVGGTVTLTWPESEAPGAIAYYVTRNGGAPGGNCPSQAEPENEVGTCIDGGLEPGTYTYKVVAKYRSWTATSSPTSAKVTVGPADHFVLTAASSTPKAAASDSLTITAKDKAGSTVTTYTGSHPLTFEGAAASSNGRAPTVVDSTGTAIAFGSPTALTFTNGIASVDNAKNGVMKLYKAGATTISVTDGAIESAVDPTVTVSAGSMSELALSAATTTPTVGSTDALTVTALDAYGNLATSYTGSHNLVYSGAAAAPAGNTPTVTNSSGTATAFGSSTKTTFTSGVTTVSGSKNGAMILYKAAAAEISVTEGTKSSTTSAAITETASPAAASSLALAASTTAPVAGAVDSLTTTALDAYGNVATSYAGPRKITFSGPEASPSGAAATVVDSAGTAVNVGSATALTFTSGVASVTSSTNGVLKAAKSGAATLSATDGTISTVGALAFTVAAGPAANLAWSAPTISSGTLGSPCLFACTVTELGSGGTFSAKVAVTDSLGNVVSNLGSGHSVSVTATAGSTVAGGSLTIASTGLAESTASFTYTSPLAGAYANTITAARSAGSAYAGAIATTSG